MIRRTAIPEEDHLGQEEPIRLAHSGTISVHKSSDRQRYRSQPFSSLLYESQVYQSHVWVGAYFLFNPNELNSITACNFSHPAYLKQCLGGSFGKHIDPISL
ncbi:hypothetical protein AYI69_g3356 [Smittium culicis]|uniref:Uncharacterized protein n=1 Tax=Smittium culicis TaxID=133412 RepID=A0A1R1YK04_9FUNG|nr:hypothetical protein AYI69_g3356 [Smittium culicis]